jgi:hypothetical protein
MGEIQAKGDYSKAQLRTYQRQPPLGIQTSRRDLWELRAQLSQLLKRHAAESHEPTRQVAPHLIFRRADFLVSYLTLPSRAVVRIHRYC